RVILCNTCSNEVSVHYRRFIHPDSPANFGVEAAFRYTRYAPAPDDICCGDNLDPVADGADWLMTCIEVLHNAYQVLVVAEIFRGAATRDDQSYILAGVDITESDIACKAIARRFHG